MTMKTLLSGAAAVLALSLASVTPANAVITTFATFTALTTDNVYFKNASSTGASSNATFYSISSPNSKTPGGVKVHFSFINLGSTLDNAVTSVNALLTFNAATASAATLSGGNYTQPGLSGTFSLISMNAITVGSTTYAAGSNLLSGVFGNADITGKNSRGNLGDDNILPDTLSYTSSFVTFKPNSTLDLSVALTAITPFLSDLHPGTDALKTFKADASGQFSADPRPIVNGVPEPTSWALMMVGFGFAGAAMRQRNRRGATV